MIQYKRRLNYRVFSSNCSRVQFNVELKEAVKMANITYCYECKYFEGEEENVKGYCPRIGEQVWPTDFVQEENEDCYYHD